MGATGFANGDGYDNNWVQSLVTNVPINLAGTSTNKLTFKTKFQAEYGYDWGWVLIKGSNGGAHWDTLASYSGDFGASCINQTIDIPDTFTTVTQPIVLQFLFGSDLNVATSDSLGAFTGWTLDDVQVKSQGNPPGGPVRFFDDMEAGSGKWLASTPNPGTLWHLESAPSTSIPASCFFLNTQLWVPFAGFGFGIVPDHADAISAYHLRWPETLTHVIEGTVEILDELHTRGQPLYAITNWNGDKFRETRARFPVLSRFRDIVVSGDERLLKPDPEIFHLYSRRNGVKLEDSLFIDDGPKNVKGAEAVGMTAHHFTTPEALRAELVEMGLL